jgi:GLPGLI family protein
MKKIVTLFSLLIFVFTTAKSQRIIAECTVTYGISTTDTSKEFTESLKASTKTVFIKANDSRTDLVSPAFTQSTFFNKTTGNAVILREFGNNKLMTKLDSTQWRDMNKKFNNASVSFTNESKIILGYECKKAIIKLTDENSFTLYYATAIVASVKEFEYQFKNVPGFVLEYEENQSGKKITYRATKVNLSPVVASKFEIPTSGYRMIN